MGKNLNVSIVLFNSDITQITNLIKILQANRSFNKIYLVDNSPSRNNLFNVSNENYIYTGKNIGYGAGHNIAIKKTIDEGVKYHLVLNPDVYFDESTICKIVKFIDSNENIGLLMPKIVYPDGKIQHLCKLLAAPLDLFGRRFIPFKKFVAKRNYKYELLFTGYDKTMQVPSLSGCFMFMRTEVLKNVGGFDERFFMYCEDVDLSRRIGQIAKTVFYPEVEVIHNYEKGSYKNLKLLKYHILSAIKYFNKWGWIFDNERKKINKRTLFNLGYFNMNKN